MIKRKQRAVALSACRGELRRQGVDPVGVSAGDALVVLDDLARRDPGLVASQWYSQATDNQLSLFEREWRRWQRRLGGDGQVEYEAG
jgi:hypothetical protein